MFVPIIKVIPVKYSCLYRAAVFLSTSVRCHPSSAYEKQITKTWFQSVWFLFHFLSDEFSYQRCEKQKVICSLELKFPGETVVTDDVSSRQIARRGRDLSMSQGSFYSCVQISVCIYFSRHWSLNAAPDLLSSFMDEHTTTVSVLILYTVLYIMLFFLPITRRPYDEKQREKNPFWYFSALKTLQSKNKCNIFCMKVFRKTCVESSCQGTILNTSRSSQTEYFTHKQETFQSVKKFQFLETLSWCCFTWCLSESSNYEFVAVT